MSMLLNTVTMTNFMPYYGNISVAFPTEDEHRNVSVIVADNMRGKTSFLNALRFAFYGRVFDRKMKDISLHLIVNSDAADVGDWACEVRVTFVAHGQSYDLRRRAAKKQLIARPTRSEDFNVVVGLLENGLPVAADQIDDKISQIAPSQTSRFFLFDGELLQDYEALLDDDSNEGARIKKTIEQVLGVPALINGKDTLSALVKVSRSKQAQQAKHNDALRVVAEQQQVLQENIEQKERDVMDLRDQDRELEIDLRELNEFLESRNLAISQRNELRLHRQRRDQCLSDQALLKIELGSTIREGWRDLLSKQLSVAVTFEQREYDRLLNDMRDDIACEGEIERLTSMLSTLICATCDQQIDSTTKLNLARKLGALQADASRQRVTSQSLATVGARLRQLQQLRSTGALPKIQYIEQQRKKSLIEEASVKGKIAEMEHLVDRDDEADVAQKKALRDGKQRNQGGLRLSLASAEFDLEQMKKREAINARRLDLGEGTQRTRASARLRVLDALEKVFSDSVNRLRDDLREKVEEGSTKAFLAMTTRASYKRLSINNNYGLTIIDDREAAVPVRSAGAEQIVALSLIAGLNMNGRPPGPIIMDTPFGRLDPNHRDNVLRYLPSVTPQLILLVHAGELTDDGVSSMAERLAARYRIKEVSARQSVIVKDVGLL